MLSNQEIEEMAAELIQIYAAIESDLLTNVARRFSVLEEIDTESIAAWQTEKLLQLGALNKENIKTISRRSGKTVKEIERILKTGGFKSLDLDEAIYKEAYAQGQLDKLALPVSLSPNLRQVIEGAIYNTREYFNMINTTALESSREGFLNIINQTYLEVSTGVSTHQQAVRKAVRQLADKGITGANYISESGRHTRNHIDVAVKRAIVTSTAQTAGKMQEKRAEEWGSNLVEVTSHMGARPTHAVWQGKIYMLRGSSDKYPNLVEATGYGSVTGLKGANCGHDFYPFFEGISEQTYKPYNLKENEKVYRQSQDQRKLEREIRQQKRRILAADATGDKELKTKAQLTLKSKEAKLKDFISTTGRTQRTDRQQVVGFGQSEAMQAVWVKRKADNYSGIIGTTTTNGISIKSISKHFGERAIERNLSITDIQEALTKPLKVGNIRVDKDGFKSQRFMGQSATVNINPDTGNAVTAWKTGKKQRRRQN